jgi:hypothetical protein
MGLAAVFWVDVAADKTASQTPRERHLDRCKAIVSYGKGAAVDATKIESAVWSPTRIAGSEWLG